MEGKVMKHRIALIGCGGMAVSHVRRFEDLYNRLEVAAIVDIDCERAENLAKLLPDKPKVFTDYHDALPCCDVVLMALPHHLHAQCTIDCLNAEKHVLAEKPLANNEEDCIDMIRAAKANNRVLMVAYCMRFHPLLIKMKELITAETYGKCFQLSIWTEQHTERAPDNWMCRKATLGGGQLFSHGCHYIDLMLWMLGHPVIGTHISSNMGTPWMEREGTSNVTITFESGAMGYHFGTWGARGTRHGYAFHAHCEEGMLEFDLAAGKLYLHSNLSKHNPGENENSKISVLAEAPSCKPTIQEMRHFLDCVETGATPITNAIESLEGLKVIWKLYEAEEQLKIANLKGYGFGTINPNDL